MNCSAVIHLVRCDLNVVFRSGTAAHISVCCFACTELHEAATQCKWL